MTDKIYRLAPLADDVHHARALPGFWLREDWLWHEPLPAVAGVLRQLEVL